MKRPIEVTTKLSITLPLDYWDPERGGAERYLDQLARSLCRRGHTLTVLCIASPVDPETVPPGMSVESLSVPSFPRFARERAFAAAAVEAHERSGRDLLFAVRHPLKADVYQPHGGCFRMAKAGALAHLGAPRRLLRTVTAAMRPTTRTLLALDRQIFDRSPHVTVISLSAHVEAGFRTAYPEVEYRFRRIYNGIDTAAFHDRDRTARRAEISEKFSIPATHPIGLFLAHRFAPKGLRHALAGVARTTNWYLLVGGRDRVGPFRRYAAQLGIENRVIFLGRVSSSRDYLSGVDALLLPSYYDPCALVVLEALSCGTPVVTTRQNGSGELVREGESGFVLKDPTHEAELATALESIAGDWEHFHRGALALRELLDWPAHVDRIEAILREVAAEKPRRSRGEHREEQREHDSME